MYVFEKKEDFIHISHIGIVVRKDSEQNVIRTVHGKKRITR